MTLGELITNFRMQKNLSQRQFATICNLSNGYISMLEKGENPSTGMPIAPTLPQLKKIALGMNLTLTELFALADDISVDLLSSGDSNSTLTPHELMVISAYRAQPAMQAAVDKLLGIDAVAVDHPHAGTA